MLTITESLAELKLIKAKVDKKETFIVNYLARQDAIKDPLEKQGGSVNAIKSERQAINDLLNRFILIRTKIAEANAKTSLCINGDTKSVAEWIVWRRDVAPIITGIQEHMANCIVNIRSRATREGSRLVKDGEAEKPSDIIVNVDEVELSEWQEKTMDTLGVLDGKLSLHNATVTIEV